MGRVRTNDVLDNTFVMLAAQLATKRLAWESTDGGIGILGQPATTTTRT